MSSVGHCPACGVHESRLSNWSSTCHARSTTRRREGSSPWVSITSCSRCFALGVPIRRTTTGGPRIPLRTPAFRPLFWAVFQHDGLLHPAMKVAGDLAHEYLTPRFQAIEELAVATVQLVERPRRDTHSVGEGAVDLRYRAGRRASGSIRPRCRTTMTKSSTKKGFQRSVVPGSPRRLWRTLGMAIPHRFASPNQPSAGARPDSVSRDSAQRNDPHASQ